MKGVVIFKGTRQRLTAPEPYEVPEPGLALQIAQRRTSALVDDVQHKHAEHLPPVQFSDSLSSMGRSARSIVGKLPRPGAAPTADSTAAAACEGTTESIKASSAVKPSETLLALHLPDAPVTG